MAFRLEQCTLVSWDTAPVLSVCLIYQPSHWSLTEQAVWKVINLPRLSANESSGKFTDGVGSPKSNLNPLRTTKPNTRTIRHWHAPVKGTCTSLVADTHERGNSVIITDGSTHLLPGLRMHKSCAVTKIVVPAGGCRPTLEIGSVGGACVTQVCHIGNAVISLIQMQTAITILKQYYPSPLPPQVALTCHVTPPHDTSRSYLTSFVVQQV
ncbi:hypothetical protein V8B97DRAFT_2038862 [Scleroderma yunnanense]